MPRENAFRFCTADGVYTKIEAMGLEDFADKLDGIDSSSILFHYPRGDFQAWIKNSIGDSELADKMCFIPRGISGESLRQELLKMVQKRVSELKALKKKCFRPANVTKMGYVYLKTNDFKVAGSVSGKIKLFEE